MSIDALHDPSRKTTARPSSASLLAKLRSKVRKKASRAAELTALFLMRLKGADVAADARIFGKVIFAGSMDNLTVGSASTLNHGVFLNLRERITIGSHVHVSPYAQLHTGSLELETLPRKHREAPIVVEDHAWIASGAVIVPGVRIGRGAVIAANSVVVDDVPAAALVGGVPARLIRRLELTPAD